MAELRAPDFKPVVLATGGTGGHVFPAEALAGELEARGVPFALVTDARGRQWQGALARRPIHYIHSASPTGSLQRRLLALLSLGLGLVDAWRALGRIDPSAVIGFGGYASVPTMIAARLRRLPAMLHEQNAVLGKANRLVLGGATRVGTSFAETRGLENDDRARLVGNPVREPVRAAAHVALSRADGRPRDRRAGVRRQPGRGLVQPGHSHRHSVAASWPAGPPAPGSAVPAGGSRPRAQGLPEGRHRRRAGAVLRRPGRSGSPPRIW